MPRKKPIKHKSPAFQFYASDFLTDTNAWSGAEVGAHVRLMCTQWVNGPLPNQVQKLAQICSLSVPEFVLVWNIVGTKYVPQPDGTIVNVRLEKVRREKSHFIELQIAKGKKGAAALKAKREKLRLAAAGPGLLLESDPSSSTSSSTSNTVSKGSSEQVPKPVDEENLLLEPEVVELPPIVEEKKIEAAIVVPPALPPQDIVGMPVSIPKPKTLHALMVKSYWDFYPETLGMAKPKTLINEKSEFAAMKSIREYMLNQCHGDEEKTLLAWQFILSKESWISMDDYLRRQVSLQDIYRNLLRIITHHKNARTTKKGRRDDSFNVAAVTALLGTDTED